MVGTRDGRHHPVWLWLKLQYVKQILSTSLYDMMAQCKKVNAFFWRRTTPLDSSPSMVLIERFPAFLSIVSPFHSNLHTSSHCDYDGWPGALCISRLVCVLFIFTIVAITFSGEWPSKHYVSPLLSILSSRSWNGFNGLFLAKVAPAKRERRWGLSKRRLGDESSLKKLAVRGLAGRAARIEYRE